MSLIVTLLLMTLVTQCWSAPQRRNWTPQAILYLKGARNFVGPRSVLERTTREGGKTSDLGTYSRVRDGFTSSLSSFILDLLQKAEEEGERIPKDQEMNFTVF